MPWVMIVLSSATTGRPSASALATGSADVDEGAGGFWASWLSGVRSCHRLRLRHKGQRLGKRARRKSRPRRVGLAMVSTGRGDAFAQRLAEAACRASCAAIVAPASASPAPVTSAIARGAGGTIEKMPSASKPITGVAARGDDAAREASSAAAASAMLAGAASLRRMPARRAASRPFMNRQETPASTPASRTTLAGEMAMANSGLPPASAASRSSAAAGRLASHRIASAPATSSRALRAPQLLGEGDLVELHVGEPGDHLAVAVEQRRVARRRAVEEHRGEVADAGLRRWRARPSRRPHRRRAPTSATPSTPRCTALRSALKTPPPTSSRIVPGLDAPGTIWAGHLAAPVDMGAADGKQFWALHAGVVLGVRDHGATIGGPARAGNAAGELPAASRQRACAALQIDAGMHPKAARRNKNRTNPDFHCKIR